MVKATTIKKGYKQTELGVIPEDWDVKELREIGSFSKGQGIRIDQSQSGELPCIRYGELYTRHSNYIKQYYSFISKEVATTAKKLAVGDILFAGSGETKEEIGKCAAFIDSIDAYAGGDVVIFSPHSTDSLFLGYLLNSPIAVKQKASKGQGDAIVHINASSLKEVQIPLPTTETEQTAIATVLSDTDALIEHLEKLIAKKKTIKQGTIQQLFTGKIRLSGFNGKWEVKKLGELVDYRNGKSFESYITEKGDYYLITLNSLDINGKLKKDHLRVNFNDKSLHKNDLIMILSDVAHGNFLGLTDLIPEDNKYVLNQRVGALKNARNVLPYYLSKYINLKQKYFKTAGQGSSQQNLAKDDILNFIVAYPHSGTEQAAISTILSDMDVEIERLEQKRDKYKMLKQGMMQQLLTGKIRLL